MKRSGRYAVSGMIEGQCEPGSRGRVLRNLIGIKIKREMDTVESRELVRTFRKLIGVHDQNHRLELLLIHPFREGNGRLARMLASLMALQAELPPLDFGMMKGRKKQEYFIAVQAGLDRNYGPMEKIIDEVIERTLRLRKQPFRSDSSGL